MARPPALIAHVVAGVGTLIGVSGFAAPAARAPHGAVVRAASSAHRGPSEITRADDGLFYVTGLVNGQPIRFLVDTGASVVTLTRADAERAGAILDDDAFDASVNTANGTAAMAWTRLRHITVAGHDIGTVDAAVPQSGLPVSLLGQNALARLGQVTLDGDRLRVAGPGSDGSQS